MSGSKLAGDFGFNVAINLAVKVVWLLGIEVAVQNSLGPEVYGQYFVFWNFCSLFYILLDLGLTQYVQRQVARDNEQAIRIAANLIPVKALLSLAYMVIIFTMAASMAIPLFFWPLLGWVAFNQILVSLLHFLRAFVAAFKHFRLDGFLSVSDRLVAILVCGAFLILSPAQFSIWHFLIALSAGWGVACVLSFIVMRRSLKVSKQAPVVSEMRTLLASSWPYGIFIALMTAYTRVDAVMLDMLLSDGSFHAGIYAAAYRLLDAVNIFGLLLAGILLPSFAAALQNKSEVQALINIGMRLIWIPAVVIVVFIWFNAEGLFDSLYKVDTTYGGRVLKVLLLNFMPVCLIYVYSTLLTAHGDLRLLNILTGLTLLANVFLNLWLIPVYKAEGAAWATLATQSIFALACIFYCVKLYGRSIASDEMLRFGLVALTALAAGFIGHMMSIPWMAAGILIAATTVVVGFLTNLIGIGIFKEVVRLKRND